MVTGERQRKDYVAIERDKLERKKNYDEVRVRVAEEKRKAVQGEKYMQECH